MYKFFYTLIKDIGEIKEGNKEQKSFEFKTFMKKHPEKKIIVIDSLIIFTKN